MKKKDHAAAALGAKGGIARWKGKSKKQRAAEMKRVAYLRWNKPVEADERDEFPDGATVNGHV